MYNQINRDFFDGALPKTVKISVVSPGGETEAIDARCEMARVTPLEDGSWLIGLEENLLEYSRTLYEVLAHECTHIYLYQTGATDWTRHWSKEWNAVYRRLVGKGLFRRTF